MRGGRVHIENGEYIVECNDSGVILDSERFSFNSSFSANEFLSNWIENGEEAIEQLNEGLVSEQIKAVNTVTFTITLPRNVACDLVQFCKRSTFDTFYNLTQIHLPHDERTRLAYLMINGIEAVGNALSDSDIRPR